MGYREKILGNAPFGYAYHEVLTDEQGCPVDYVFIDVNQSFEKMTGLLAKDVVNKKISDVLPTLKDDPFDWIAVYGHIAINGGEKEFEQYSEPLGKWFQVQVSSPEKYYFATIFTDITNAKLLQQSKDEAQMQVYKSLESISDGFFTIDKDNKVIHFSKGAEEILGWELSEVLHRPLYDSSFEISLSVFGREYIAAVTDDGVRCFEAWLGKTGMEECYEIRVIPNENGKGIYFHNITERKRWETRLMKSEDVFNNCLDMFCVAGFDGYFKHINPAWTRILGWEADELLSKPWIDFVHPDDRDATENVKSKIINGREVYQFENRYFCKDGSVRWLSWNSYPRAGEKVMFGVARDVTDRKGVEEKLHLSELKLTQQIEEYSAINEEMILANEELRSTTEDLSESNQRINALLNALPDIIFVFNKRGDFLESHSGNIAEITLPSFSFEKKNFFQTLPLPVAMLIKQHIDLVFKTGEQQLFQYRLEDEGKIQDYEARMVQYDDDKALMVSRNITLIKETENKLRQSEQVMRYIIKYDPNAMAIFDNNMNYIATSDRFLSDYKVTEKDVLGKNHYDIFPEMPQKWIDVHQSALRGNIEKNDDDFFIRPDGSITYTRWECRPWYQGDGSIGGMISYTEVITERKLAEMALQESEMTFRALFEKGPIGVAYHKMIYDLSGEPVDYFFIDANKSYQNLTGVNPIGKKVTEAFPGIEKDPFNWIGTFGKVAKFGEEIRFQQYLESNNRWYDCVGYQYKPDHFVAAFLEITSQKIYEQALRENEIKYRMLFESNKDGLSIYRFDKDGHPSPFIEANMSAGLMVGYTKEELLEQNILDFDIEYSPEKLEKCKADMTNQGFAEFETAIRHKLGHPIEVEVKAIQILYNNEPAVLNITRDISERRKAEKAIRENEKQIAVAKEAVRFKQNFLANMSHEIRTPLTGIMGVIDLLSETGFDDERQGHFEILKNTSESLMEIVNQVLDFSKIEDGKLSLKYIDFNFREFLHQSIEFYGGLCKERIGISITIDELIPEFINADKSRLTQVLNNLLSNAVKFTRKGSIKVETILLDMPKTPQNKTFAIEADLCIKISVMDTGIGIDPEKQKDLFRPFVQIDDTETRAFEGTGLGLSISKQLVELHGGQIGIESTPGKGSTFWFTFLAKSSHYNHKPELLDEVNNRREIGKLRILLAEDKVINQKVISLLLSHMGFEVCIASHGQEAVDIFEHGKFDLILMDIQMPVMDGITATRLLKEKHRDLPPIVGLSANAFEGDREKYMSNGMDEYLTKPLRKEEFMDILNRVL